jgi:hypothetical protein
LLGLRLVFFYLTVSVSQISYPQNDQKFTEIILLVPKGGTFALCDFLIELELHMVECSYSLQLFNSISQARMVSSWYQAMGPVSTPGQMFFICYAKLKCLKGFDQVLSLISANPGVIDCKEKGKKHEI